jgi:hypothetical protein
MDDYGCMRLTKEDAKEVRDTLDKVGSVVFALSGDQIGAMIILICTRFNKSGTMPFGGNPTGRAYVGVYGMGCNHFSKDQIHPSYFAEKLKLHEGDAETLAKFWDLLWLNRD